MHVEIVWALIKVWMVVLGSGFFFFKQKTAYEMRISDWSSDVCSSDLPVTELANAQEMLKGFGVHDHVETLLRGMLLHDLAAYLGQLALQAAHTSQIGRASCRERVC